MITVHLIDGDAGARLAARRVLESAGFRLTEAADPTAAAPPGAQLVIADLAVASLSAIRRDHPRAQILAVVGEGDAPPSPGSLRKPFTPSQLLAAVRRRLAGPDATT